MDQPQPLLTQRINSLLSKMFVVGISQNIAKRSGCYVPVVHYTVHLHLDHHNLTFVQTALDIECPLKDFMLEGILLFHFNLLCICRLPNVLKGIMHFLKLSFIYFNRHCSLIKHHTICCPLHHITIFSFQIISPSSPFLHQRVLAKILYFRFFCRMVPISKMSRYILKHSTEISSLI